MIFNICIPQASAGGTRGRAFKITFAVPVLGAIVIYAVEIFMVSQSMVLTICLVVISTMLGKIFFSAEVLCHLEDPFRVFVTLGPFQAPCTAIYYTSSKESKPS
ncbi:hypothetical protein V8B97DRAFT_1879150 [Scleroderma yunnanense]